MSRELEKIHSRRFTREDSLEKIHLFIDLLCQQFVIRHIFLQVIKTVCRNDGKIHSRRFTREDSLEKIHLFIDLLCQQFVIRHTFLQVIKTVCRNDGHRVEVQLTGIRL